MNKTLLSLALILSVGATSCRFTKDEPKIEPQPNPTEKPTEPKEEPAPKPEAKIVIEDGVLKSYPASLVPTDGAVSLPAEVTEIGEEAFKDNAQLKTLVAPGLKKIGARAFQGASALELVDVSSYTGTMDHPYPETGEDAFTGTPATKAIKLPAKPSYTAWFEYIALHSFGAIEGIEAKLPAGAVVRDGELISLPKGYRADAVGLLVLPPTVTKIGEAFLNQDRDTSRTGIKLIYGLGVKEIGNGAFSDSYVQFAHFPQLTKIGIGAFGGLSGMKTLSFPQLTEIGDLCFLPAGSPNRSALYFLSLPALKSIGKGSFSGTLGALKTLVLGAMPTLDKTPYTVAMSNKLEGEWVPFFSGNKVTFDGGRAAGATLRVPASTLSSYGVEAGALWEGFTLRTF